MPNTKRFIQLNRELIKAKRAFLPIEFNATGTYSELQSDRARAFLLVAHAEIESFIEDVVKNTVKTAIELWTIKQKTSVTLTSLTAYIFLEDGEPRWKNLNERINYANGKFNKLVNENHGVRSSNLKQLLMPVGQDLETMDSLFLTEIDDFGKSRGSAAHTSNLRTTGRTVFDPKLEYERVFDKLLPHLKTLDINLRKLSR